MARLLLAQSIVVNANCIQPPHVSLKCKKKQQTWWTQKTSMAVVSTHRFQSGMLVS